MSKKFSAGDIQIARRMLAAGIPGELSVVDQALVIHQEEEPYVNSLASCYLLSNYMGSTIQAYIKVIYNQSAPFIVCGFDLCLPWNDTPAILLQDPAEFNAPQIYKFPGYSASQFDKSQIIHQSNETLSRRQPLEGYLLAIGPGPIPPEIQQGARVIAELTIFDQFGAGHPSDLFLWVDRSAEWGPKPKARKPLRRLFDRPDNVVEKLPPDAEAVVEGKIEIVESAGVGK